MGNYRFFFKGVQIDERTEEYIKKRLDPIGKLLDKKGKFRVEVMVETPYKLYRSEETSESIEGSVDIVESELRMQITKDKDKRKTLVKRGGLSLKKKITLDENSRF